MVVVGVSRTGMRTIPPRRAAEGRSFGVSDERSAQVGGTVATGAVAVAALLALQESESEVQQDREARQHGEAVVDELVELQRALLGSEGPDLDRLASLAARPVAASDPALAGVLRAVRLRAGIELARRGRATSM